MGKNGVDIRLDDDDGMIKLGHAFMFAAEPVDAGTDRREEIRERFAFDADARLQPDDGVVAGRQRGRLRDDFERTEFFVRVAAEVVELVGLLFASVDGDRERGDYGAEVGDSGADD